MVVRYITNIYIIYCMSHNTEIRLGVFETFAILNLTYIIFRALPLILLKTSNYVYIRYIKFNKINSNQQITYTCTDAIENLKLYLYFISTIMHIYVSCSPQATCTPHQPSRFVDKHVFCLRKMPRHVSLQILLHMYQ